MNSYLIMSKVLCEVCAQSTGASLTIIMTYWRNLSLPSGFVCSCWYRLREENRLLIHRDRWGVHALHRNSHLETGGPLSTDPAKTSERSFDLQVAIWVLLREGECISFSWSIGWACQLQTLFERIVALLARPLLHLWALAVDFLIGSEWLLKFRRGKMVQKIARNTRPDVIGPVDTSKLGGRHQANLLWEKNLANPQKIGLMRLRSSCFYELFWLVEVAGIESINFPASKT